MEQFDVKEFQELSLNEGVEAMADLCLKVAKTAEKLVEESYAEIKEYVLEKYGLKVSQLYIAQVKRKHGIIERINYNVGEGKAKVPQVPMDKEKAIEDALRYFQMI